MPVADSAEWLPRLCATLGARGVHIHTATATVPTLDDLFFHHTGRPYDLESGTP